jgi:fission process protein 1
MDNQGPKTSDTPSKSASSGRDHDVFRDTPLRYMGYANEVGEAFRALIHVNWVRFSYAVASSYVVAHAYSRGRKEATAAAAEGKVSTDAAVQKRRRVTEAVVDTLVWQGLASVAVPGFTINRICWLANSALQTAARLPPATRKWTVTAIGLGAIPVIIRPIDHSVDFVLDRSLRRLYHCHTESKGSE